MDWNNDGKKDLLVGDSTPGRTHLFINEGTDAAPVLGPETIIVFNGVEEYRSGRAAPYVVDWDEDGRKDLIIGQKDGRILLLINGNTDDDPVFPGIEYVLAGFEQLDVGLRSNPKMPDWDNDGKKDILTGEYLGFIYFYPNIGTHSDPDFGPREQLKAGGEIVDVGDASRIDIVDWNNDGLPDILSGCKEGTVFYFEQEFIFSFESITPQPGTGTKLVWRSRLGDSYTVYSSDDLASWTPISGSIPSQGVTTEWTDTSPPSATCRFYKVALNGS